MNQLFSNSHQGYEPKIKFHNQQLVSRLKSMMHDSNLLIVKTNALTNTLNAIMFNDIKEEVNNFCLDLHHSFIGFEVVLKEVDPTSNTIQGLSKAYCDTANYSGWVDRVKELISIHLKIRDQILNVFMNYNESDFLNLFQFLKSRLKVHEKQLWILRGFIEN